MSALESITKFIREAQGIDLENFRPSFIERRLSKRMKLAACTDLSDYYTFLVNNNDEIDALVDELRITVSWFYRNPIMWEILKIRVLPKLIDTRIKQKKEFIRIWVAGCARGEEPFTLAILIYEIIKKQNYNIIPQIFATDIDPGALTVAKSGIYDTDAFKNLPFGLLEKYFEKTKAKFKAQPLLKEIVHFSTFDLLDSKRKTPPEAVFTTFDIVICQNVMIYYQDVTQRTIFSKLARAVSEDGYLILGESETLMDQRKNEFVKISDLGNIYQKHN
ncbi:MAG: protein-glutamate O-methyltransferase CheR [Candidatus Marinimicrobia bacterium]|nr:protein-glutamate O-methyltransferase CheR [Candidatus Neomarinimicrobiota bacterium]